MQAASSIASLPKPLRATGLATVAGRVAGDRARKGWTGLRFASAHRTDRASVASGGPFGSVTSHAHGLEDCPRHPGKTHKCVRVAFLCLLRVRLGIG
jgi:hypothetical protein